MKELEMEGKTVTQAVESGLKELGLRRDQVEVQVLDEGAPGFLGLGAKPARVRVRAKHWEGDAPRGEAPSQVLPRKTYPQAAPPRRERRAGPEEKKPAAEAPPVDTEKACKEAQDILNEMLSLMGLSDASLRCAWDADQERVRAEVESSDGALLIGKNGKTLEAVQFLATVVLGRKMQTPVAVQVDTHGYWRKIEERILSDVERAVREVQRTGTPYRFDPMEPSLRRLVHRSLAGHPDVESASEGEGAWRKVVLSPRRKGH